MGRIAPHQGTRRRRQVLGGAPRAVQVAHPERCGAIAANAGHPEAPFTVRESLRVSCPALPGSDARALCCFAANIRALSTGNFELTPDPPSTCPIRRRIATPGSGSDRLVFSSGVHSYAY